MYKFYYMERKGRRKGMRDDEGGKRGRLYKMIFFFFDSFDSSAGSFDSCIEFLVRGRGLGWVDGLVFRVVVFV